MVTLVSLLTHFNTIDTCALLNSPFSVLQAILPFITYIYDYICCRLSCCKSFIIFFGVRYATSLNCYLHSGVYHDTSWKNTKVIETCFHRCTSLHIMINHEVPGYIIKDPEGYWNNFLSFMMYHDQLWQITITYGKVLQSSWKIIICHDLHNISERWRQLSN